MHLIKSRLTHVQWYNSNALNAKLSEPSAHVVNMELSNSNPSIFNYELSNSHHPLLTYWHMWLEFSFQSSIHICSYFTLKLCGVYVNSLNLDEGVLVKTSAPKDRVWIDHIRLVWKLWDYFQVQIIPKLLLYTSFIESSLFLDK